jgi:hypothetical protein
MNLQKDAIEKDMVDLALSMQKTNPDLGAFVFECHNLAPYSQAVHLTTGLPVFDIVDYADWVYCSINKRAYPSPYQSSQS